MAPLKQFFRQHPRLVAWAVLAIGFVVILLFSARDMVFASPDEGGFTLGQTIALIVSVIGLAGLCVWIIGWEDDEEEEEGEEEESDQAEAGQEEPEQA